MKTFITLAVVCLVASALATPIELNEEQKVKAKVYHDECLKQENVSEEDAAKLRNKDYVNPSKNLKCFGTCFFEKAGTLKNDEIQEEVVIAKLGAIIGEEKTKKIIETCKTVKGEDRCDTGFQIYKCFETTKAEMKEAEKKEAEKKEVEMKEAEKKEVVMKEAEIKEVKEEAKN